MLIEMQGPIAIQLTALVPSELERKRQPARESVQRRLRDHLDWRGGRHDPDKAAGRQHVS